MTDEQARRASSSTRTAVDRRTFLATAAGIGVGVASSLATVPRVRAAEGGELLWQFEAQESVESSPTVVDGIAFLNVEGYTYAIDVDGGEQLWEHQREHGSDGAPVVVDETVYSGGQTNVGLDPETGDELTSVGGGHLNASVTVTDELLYYPNYHSVRAVDLETGDRRWGFDTGDEVESTPTVWDGSVYATSTNGTLYAIDATSGDERWRFETDDSIYAGATVADGVVFVGSTDMTLYAVDAETGNEVWRVDTYPSPVSTVPTVADGTVYFGGNDDNLWGVDVASGDPVLRFGTDERVESSPTIADGTAFVGSADNTVYAVDVESGEAVWSYDTGDNVDSSPIVVDGTLYVGSLDGSLYAIDAGVDGSSNGSRVRLGTLNHHGGLATASATTGMGGSGGDSIPGFGLVGGGAAAVAGGYAAARFWRDRGE